jgi:hypothetical protein
MPGIETIRRAAQVDAAEAVSFPLSKHKGPMSSAKLQVRPILLKKISFMIFFNSHLSDYETIRCHRKEKIN